MKFMNTWEIDSAQHHYADHPILGPATRTLASLRDAADANSDGWCYWPKPARAAAKLMELIEGEVSRYRYDADQARPDATLAKLRRAYTPLKAFRTRSNLSFIIYEPEA